MSKTAVVSIGVSTTGDGYNMGFSVPTITNTNSPGSGDPQHALTTGLNTIAVPPTAVGVIISPPVNSTVTKTYKTVLADTGDALAPALASCRTFVPGSIASIYITASGPETLAIVWF